MLQEDSQLDHYRLLQLIGRGGMGDVYLTEDIQLKRQVAIKIITPHPNQTKLKEALRLFQREMQAIAKLDHPRILPLYDYGEANVNGMTYTYMVMPFRKEGTLDSWYSTLQDKNPQFLSLQDVAHFLSQAADALQYAHDDPSQIIHLDVKPSNFLIRSNKENPNCPDLLLADFGIAKFINATLGASDTVRGTAAFMPPEQWKGDPKPASDQYALAIMVYQLLTNRLPFRGTPEQLIYQHLHVQPEPPSKLNPRLPTDIDTVILKALQKNYKDRFASISQFANAFQQALVSHADIRVILAISEAEALSGIAYPLTLPGGRSVSVAVPAGTQDGQVIRLDGMGEASNPGGPVGALITTIAIKPRSKSEQEIVDQLQSLSKDIYALRSNPPVDQKLKQQIQQLSKDITDLQSNATNSDQKIILQLQNLSKDISALQANQGNNQTILNQLQSLSKDIAALKSSNSNQTTINHLQSLSKDITALKSTINNNQGLIDQQMQALSKNITNLPSSPNSNQTISDKLKEIALTASNIQSSMTTTTSNTNSLSCFVTVMSAVLVLLVAISGLGLYYVYQTNATLASKQANTNVAINPPDPYPPYKGKLSLNDPLSRPSQWDNAANSSFGGTCQFTKGTYHIIQSKVNSVFFCTPSNSSTPDLSNFTFEVQMRIIKGDCGGFIFRHDNITGKDYTFTVCQYGSYSLYKYVDNSGANTQTLANGPSPTINTGLNQLNIVAIVANGSMIELYVNDQKIESVHDSAYSHGHFGLVSDAINNPTEVVYSSAKVWTL